MVGRWLLWDGRFIVAFESWCNGWRSGGWLSAFIRESGIGIKKPGNYAKVFVGKLRSITMTCREGGKGGAGKFEELMALIEENKRKNQYK